MFYFSRGGTRGGKDQFNWDDIKGDKHKEFYLGNSLHTVRPTFNCPKPNTGWYLKKAEQKTQEEIDYIKEKEASLLNQALGIKPKKNIQSNRKLDNTEISELTRRGTTERGNLDIDRVEGLGFAPAFTHEASAPTLLEGNVDNYKAPTFIPHENISKKEKSKKKEKKKHRKHKKEKKEKKKKRRMRHDSDDEDDDYNNKKRKYRYDSEEEKPTRKRRRYTSPSPNSKDHHHSSSNQVYSNDKYEKRTYKYDRNERETSRYEKESSRKHRTDYSISPKRSHNFDRNERETSRYEKESPRKHRTEYNRSPKRSHDFDRNEKYKEPKRRYSRSPSPYRSRKYKRYDSPDDYNSNRRKERKDYDY